MSRLVIPLIVVAGVTGTLTACGGDADGTGEVVDDAKIEARIAAAMEREFHRKQKVNCPDDGIEAGTDFTCIAYPVGLDDRVTARIETHLDSDGKTIEPFDPEPQAGGGF